MNGAGPVATLLPDWAGAVLGLCDDIIVFAVPNPSVAAAGVGAIPGAGTTFIISGVTVAKERTVIVLGTLYTTVDGVLAGRGWPLTVIVTGTASTDTL